MEVFIAGADESDVQRFVYGGYAASAKEWGLFSEHWEARVLAAPPAQEYFHVTDLYREDWRAKNPITDDQVRHKLDQAAEVIYEHPRLIPVTWSVAIEEYDRLVRRDVLLYGDRKQPQEKSLSPDFVFFVDYVLRQIVLVKERHPDVSRVDFWVEQKNKISPHLGEFEKMIPALFRSLKRPELIPLMGDVMIVPKNRIQTQAADYLVWHQRNGEIRLLGPDEKRRYSRISERHPSEPDSDTRKWRFGSTNKIDGRLEQMADALDGLNLDGFQYES